jgi:hypothetical protein
MDRDEEYKGHTISVSTRKLGHGFAWSYVIDGSKYGEQRGDKPLSEELALSEGIGEAKFVVDQMTKAK